MTEQHRHILVVDDDRQTRLVLTREPESRGYAVSAVEGGDEALRALATESFDLILLDILMPKMDGVEVLARLRVDAKQDTPEVIVISALEDSEMMEKCRELGARHYLTKPVDPELLDARIAEVLA
jgi:sigma-B regulation protein RsbU (phosphoserine phosphatase)